MAQVNVTISGRVYRMACEDGQEEHLQGLAARLDQTISHLRESFGEIGDQRLTVMAAIMSMDEAGETSKRIRALETENQTLREARNRAAAERAEIEDIFARRLEEAARRIEELAASLTNTRPGG